MLLKKPPKPQLVHQVLKTSLIRKAFKSTLTKLPQNNSEQISKNKHEKSRDRRQKMLSRSSTLTEEILCFISEITKKEGNVSGRFCYGLQANATLIIIIPLYSAKLFCA